MKLFQGDKKGLQADQGPVRGGRGKHVIIFKILIYYLDLNDNNLYKHWSFLSGRGKHVIILDFKLIFRFK